MASAPFSASLSASAMAPRARVGFVATALLALLLLSAQAAALWPRMPSTALATIIVGIILALVLLALGLQPRWVQSFLRRHASVDVSRESHAWALLLLVVGVFVSVIYGALVGGIAAFEGEVVLGSPAPDLAEVDIVSNVALSALIFILPAWIYVRVVHAASAQAAWRLLGVASRRPAFEVLIGTGIALVFLLALGVAGALVDAVGAELPENERAAEIAMSVGPAGAILLALGASLGEEVFFRGFLQPRIGVVGQALVFMSGHLAYLNVVELVVTFSLALAFGYAYRRTGSLVAPIVAHFTFNAVMLLGARFAGLG